ncbi:Hypothetical protein PHPALM_3946, partial [Phytophthora palmivora]
MGTFQVVKLTQESLKIQCKVDDFEEWGVPLNLTQYQRKEELQRETPFSQRGSIFWALVEDNGNSADDDVVAGQSVLYCHCESHRFDCVVRRSSGEIERGYSHHIGSVFTLPEHRKRGLAKYFMTQVATQLEKLPGALVSVLYSDIGPTYYDSLGWKLHPSKMATLDAAHVKNAKVGIDTSAELVSLTLDEKLDEFLQVDNERLVDEMSSEKYAGREVFVVLPTRDSIEWQFCIGVYFAQVREYDELPCRCGVKVDKDAFIIWCHNLKASTLYVVRARFPENDAEITCLLLNEALEEARKFKLKKVAIWDPPAALQHADKFRLVQLTQEVLKVQCKTDDHEHWGAPLLTVEQWQQKDEAQRLSPFSQEGALFWALVDRKEKDSSTSDAGLVAGRDLLYCHCKTMRFDCVYRHSNGDIERGYSYEISSVYTLPEFRKRGLAGFFLTEVTKELENLPKPLISVLYSDVGPTFYDKLGWKCHPSKMATVEVDHPRNANASELVVEMETMFLDEKLAKFLEGIVTAT